MLLYAIFFAVSTEKVQKGGIRSKPAEMVAALVTLILNTDI